MLDLFLFHGSTAHDIPFALTLDMLIPANLVPHELTGFPHTETMKYDFDITVDDQNDVTLRERLHNLHLSLEDRPCLLLDVGNSVSKTSV